MATHKCTAFLLETIQGAANFQAPLVLATSVCNAPPRNVAHQVPKQGQSLVFHVEGVHRLPGEPRENLDYYVVDTVYVQHYEDPLEGKWTKKTIPPGISVFIPLPADGDHGYFNSGQGCNILGGTLPEPFRMTYVQVLRLKMIDGSRKQTARFHVYVRESGVTKEKFVGILKNSETSSQYQWLVCSQICGSGLCTDLFRREDADDFEDCKVRILHYYVSEWYKQCDTDDITIRVLMNGFYMWLTEQKPTLRDIAEDSAHSSFALYLLQNFSAAIGDDMGGAELEDIEESLKSEVALVNAL